ncbi:TetR/AcrR family transcriptional regulator [Pseudonocardia bannensis]|uniref:TetR/AcrR family transcriptional regulator n=1 Tax=Pseudonocardia bannensis TaxID=630973 RepID=UPI0028AD09C8|nr:TetR/AcrR family transcriptional regulator [Pseudonocardia bannensis]
MLDATLGLLAEVGYSRLTVEGVAARAGVGKSTVYRWWSSKGTLVIEALHSRLNHTPVSITKDTRADLRAALLATFESFADSAIGETIPAVAVDLLRDPDAAERLESLLQPPRDSVRAVIEAAADSGDLPADVDVRLLQDLVAGTLLYRRLLRRTSPDPVVDQLLDLILDGRVPRAEQPQDSPHVEPVADTRTIRGHFAGPT